MNAGRSAVHETIVPAPSLDFRTTTRVFRRPPKRRVLQVRTAGIPGPAGAAPGNDVRMPVGDQDPFLLWQRPETVRGVLSGGIHCCTRQFSNRGLIVAAITPYNPVPLGDLLQPESPDSIRHVTVTGAGGTGVCISHCRFSVSSV